MEIISLFLEKMVDYSVRPIGKQFGYLIFYKSSIASLREKLRQLSEKEMAVKQTVAGAKWEGKEVAPEVETWLTNVYKKIGETQEFLEEEDARGNWMCLNGWCPDLNLRYSLGKKAQKNTQAIVQLMEDAGRDYGKMYNYAPPSKGSSSTNEQFEDFQSRKSTIQDVLEALRDDNIDMIALCGMGGVGKTEMAKKIRRRVERDNLFNKVAFAVVSQSPSLTKIQGELAEWLGPRLELESESARAEELHSRLTKNKNVLVILDDVWGSLSLEAIGVIKAFEEKSCKILLTSRSEETCNAIGIQKKIRTFPVGLLSAEEAWNLFEDMVGDCIKNNRNLYSLAKQVANECACLPLALAIVGRALSNETDENYWKAAHQELQMSNPQHIIYELHPKVYSSIELSYNYLKSDEAKSCFLLCCFYPEDYDIPVEHLVRYGAVKRFFKGLDTVEQTRVRVHAIVKNLKRSNLLLDSYKEECVKMHDVVRDVAISIASRDEHGFKVVLDRELKKWPQMDRYNNYTAISLLLGEMKGHPTELKCPKLQLLQLSCLNSSETLADNLFKEMEDLKMLSLQTMCSSQCRSLMTLPLSMQILKKLQMLNLENCLLGDVSPIGNLTNLEILVFRKSKIKELPVEIGKLSQLKLLDMRGCNSLERIARGVFSSLSELQELYLGKVKNWENGEATNNHASIAELPSELVVLEIRVPNILSWPKELNFSKSNFRFMIDIVSHDQYWPNERYFFENTLKLKVEDASDLGEHQTILSLLKNVVNLNLDIAKISEQKILPCNLKDLTISRCEDLEYLLEATLDSTDPPNTSLDRLKTLSLIELPRLVGICNSTDSVEVEKGGSTASTAIVRKLFSSNNILWVPNLEHLRVESCGSLEVSFDLEGLKVKENRKPILPVLSDLYLHGLSGMSHVWKNIPPGFQGFQNLTSITIRKCDSLRNLIPPSIAKLLVQLQIVNISYCNLMENIIQREYEAEEEIRGAAILSDEAHSFKWPSIKEIYLTACPKLKTFVSNVKSRRKITKPRAQEPSAGSSSARESSRHFNRCLESCVPRLRNYSPAQGNISFSLGEIKHDLIHTEITLTKQEEQNVSETENQAKMLSLFPYNFIESLENLRQLFIHDCESLEVIFELEGGRNAEESKIFNNLTDLSLAGLPKLLHIWKKGPRDMKGFNYLRRLKVWGCDSLKCLFTPSIAKLLVKLEVIEVGVCNEMEEIVAKESGDEKNRSDVIAFPLLKRLWLLRLQKLECFYREDNHVFEWPSLGHLMIEGCPELKMFVSTSTKTPKLEGVYMESFQPMVEGDLNATIHQYIIKGKGLP